MSPEQTAFLTFVRTGAFGVIQPEMDVDTVNDLLPGCDYRPNPPYERLIGEHIEISFEDRRMTQVRVRFIVHETDPWTTEVAPWFHWLQTMVMEDLERFLLLQEHQVEYRCLGFEDGSCGVELTHPRVWIAYDTPQQIYAIFRLYKDWSPWQPYTIINTFPHLNAEDNPET